jgi:hypothetical protein
VVSFLSLIVPEDVMRTHLVLLICLLLPGSLRFAHSQISVFPYRESFDSVSLPLLPAGWISSREIAPDTNDFITTVSTPRSAPQALFSANATIAQHVTTPVFDFAGRVPSAISFYTRRSGTHTARVVLEASTDGGATFSLQIGDSLINTGATTYVQSTFPLPGSLSGLNTVRFRWRVVPAPSGATGTFRIDDVLLTVNVANDIALTSLRFLPSLPVEGDTVLAFARARNAGTQAAPSFTVRYFNDVDGDSIPDPDELVNTSAHVMPLQPGDSIEVSAALVMRLPGVHRIIAVVDFSPDENNANNSVLRSLQVGYRSNSVIINEIMYGPIGAEPEWVELYNRRDDGISMRNWIIGDATARRTITSAPIVVPPRGYLLLTGDSVGLRESRPDVAARIVDVPSFPTLNNGGDAVVLIDNGGVRMDSLSYLPVWGGSEGRSLERRDPEQPSMDQSNWGTSTYPGKGSPGQRNSISRKDRDLTLQRLTMLPTFPLHGDSVRLMVVVGNSGFLSVPSFQISLFKDINGDSLRQPNELLQMLPLTMAIAPLDSIVIFLNPHYPIALREMLFVTIHFTEDEDTLNNTAVLLLRTGYLQGSVVINEIMHSPAGEPEWVELYNTLPESVDVAEWQVSNRTVTSRYGFGLLPIRIPSDEFLVLCKDTALLLHRHRIAGTAVLQLPSLPTFLFSNSGDAAVLFDARGFVMDSIRYSPGWGGTGGRSLERLDPLWTSGDSLNWLGSVDPIGSTPGRANSNVTYEFDVRANGGLDQRVVPGSPAQLRVVLRNAGRQPVTDCSVAFYLDADRDSVPDPPEFITRLSVTSGIERRDSLVVSHQWQSPPPGAHDILAVAEYPPDQRPSDNGARLGVSVGYPRNALVINEIMFAPLTGEAEYVELYNAYTESIDMNNWRVSDGREGSSSAGGYLLRSGAMSLAPGAFFVLASDSSVLQRFPGLDTLENALLHIANSSSLGLGNEGDAVVIADQSLTIVDSTYYSPAWHHAAVTDASGRSLERIHPGLPSHEARSWSSSVLAEGGTPGRVNSIFTTTLPSQASLSCSPSPFSPDGDGYDDFTLIRYSLPVQLARVRMRIFDVRGRMIRYLVNNEPSGPQRAIVWDGYDDDSQKARIGIYIVLVEGLDEGGGVIHAAKGVVVLAAKL